MALSDCVAGTTTPIVTINPGGPPGTIVLTPTGPQTVIPAGGVAGANFHIANATAGVTLPKAPTAGNLLIAIAIAHIYLPPTFVPTINPGWNQVSAGDHNTTGLDPGTRLLWKLAGAGESQIQTPISGSGDYTISMWEVSGLDPTFTPSFLGVDINSPSSGGSSVDITSSYPAGKLFLFAGVMFTNSSDPGVPTEIGAFIVDSSDHSGVNPCSGFCAHSGATATPECGISFGSSHQIAGMMVAFNVAGVVGTGGTAGTTTVPLGGQVAVSVNGSTVTTAMKSLNVVGDVTLTNDGAGNLTLTVPSATGPYIDMVASETIANGALVSFWNSSGAKVRNADDADDSKQVDGFVLVGGASGATLRVYLPGAVNTAVSGLTPGAIYFLDGTGGITATAPTTSGKWLQEVGKAADAAHLAFNPKTGTLL